MSRILKMSSSLKEQILERDAYICAYCDGEANSVDHIVPYSYCQNNDPNNLVAACMDCNLIASDMVFDSFSEKREYIRAKREGRKWQKRFKNKYSVCTECGQPFCEGTNGATHFICKDCNTPELEWKRKW